MTMEDLLDPGEGWGWPGGEQLCCVCVCVQAEERRSHVEVCAEGGVLVQQLARRISRDGGAALIADYGHDGTKSDTFRVRPCPHNQWATPTSKQQSTPANNQQVEE